MVKGKIGRRVKFTEYQPGHLRVLLHGSVFWPDQAPGFYRPGFGVYHAEALDLAAVKKVWKALGAELLERWIAENPGTRPFAWWLFDAPEPRRRMLTGPKVLWVDSLTCPPNARKWWFGVPACTSGGDHEQKIVFESQAAFLERHGLLTEAERKALGKRLPAEQVIFGGR